MLKNACQSKPLLIGAAVALIAVLGAINHAAGHLVTLPVFWLLPVLLVALHCGRRAGMLTAVLAISVQTAEFLYFGRLTPGGVDYPLLFVHLLASGVVASLIFSFQHALERLRATQTLRDDLTHVLVHDLKHPLTSAELALDLLATSPRVGEFAGADELRLIGIARRSLEQLEGMAGEVLTIALAEAGELEPNLQRTDLRALVDDALAEARERAAERQITLVENLNGPLPVACDAARLRRVLWNLLDNALKFTPTGGEIAVAITPTPSAAHIAVRDTGPGIPPEIQPLIFDKFAQPQAGRQGHNLSIGLGLYYSRLVVAAHGGRISVESQPGQGSEFRLTLPLAPETPSP
jgi:signal transduction histidine kinase